MSNLKAHFFACSANLRSSDRNAHCDVNMRAGTHIFASNLCIVRFCIAALLHEWMRTVRRFYPPCVAYSVSTCIRSRSKLKITTSVGATFGLSIASTIRPPVPGIGAKIRVQAGACASCGCRLEGRPLPHARAAGRGYSFCIPR